jgi:hypothetical protein
MDWTRGLLRFWGALSIGWIIVAGLGDRPDVRMQDYLAKRSDYLSISQMPNGPWLSYRPEYVNLTGEQRVALADAERKSALDRLEDSLIELPAPPLILLVLGIVIRWIILGFRAQAKKTDAS